MQGDFLGHIVTGAAAALGLGATLLGEQVLQLDAGTTLGGLGTGIGGALAWQLWRIVGTHVQATDARLQALKEEALHRADERQHWSAMLGTMRALLRQLRGDPHTPVEGIPLEDDAAAPGLYHQGRTPPPPRRR